MEKTEKNQRSCNKQPETDLFLQWGNRKRLRCFRVRDPEIADPSYAAASGGRIRRKVTSRFGPVAGDKQPHRLPLSTRLTRNSETAAAAALRSEHNRKLSPEKEDKYYSTRGSSASAAAHAVVEEKKAAVDGGGSGGGGGGGEGNSNNGNNQKGKSKGHVWPKLYISLSSKEKEEDFMAMKGCKPPQRPKKRAKIIQRTLLLVSPGAWLTDMCQERYEVREKKTTKKRPRGLKAMGSSMESDSE